MAKAFYSQDEAKAALNTNENGLKELVREGRLTEYRDGQNLMYKGSQVEALASELGSGDAVNLSDTGGGTIGLVDSRGGSGSAIGLADTGRRGGSVSGGSGGFVTKEDTAGGFALTESDTGVDPVSASASGITIFGPDESGIADPGAQTSLHDTSGEQVNLEGIGSGSGLLDLTQEPDDTSFGAETFDEIMPGETGMGTVAGIGDTGAGIDTGAMPAGVRGAAMVYEPYDPSAPLFGGMAAGAAAAVLLGLLAVAAAALNAAPGLLGMFYSNDGPKGAMQVNMVMTLAVLLGLPIIGAIIGAIGGRVAS